MLLSSDHNPLILLIPQTDVRYLGHNYTVLISGLDGFITDKKKHGLFVYQTRMLSHYRYTIDGNAWEPNASANVTAHSWQGYYLSPPPGGKGNSREPTAQYTLELILTRYFALGMNEEAFLTNYTQEPVKFRLCIEIDVDFADQKQPLNNSWRGEEEISHTWQASPQGGAAPGSGGDLVYNYHVTHAFEQHSYTGTAELDCGHTIRVEQSDSPAYYKDEQIQFDIQLKPLESWHLCLKHIPRLEKRSLEPLPGCNLFHPAQDEYEQKRRRFSEEATEFLTPESGNLMHVVGKALSQARDDLLALRLYDFDHGENAWLMAAGLPTYIALFGRDTLTAAWQAALTSPDMMRGVIMELPRWQGQADNPWRDEWPGRMIHEANSGPLAFLNYIPLRRYYGSVTTSAFYPVVLSEFWHWTGDGDTIEPLIEPALKGLQYLEQHCRNAAGFYQYQTRSRQGLKHQAWKDSGDAVVYEDGSQVDTPIATCEEQGFIYAAKLQFAEICLLFGRREEATRLFREAGELKKRFNETFWMEEEGTFAFGIDPQGRLIRSIVSNPGHCLAAGIADTDLVSRTAQRLMSPDLFSGWGIRTLSAGHPAYNPYSYHRGSVWPVEQGTFSLGFYRYGLFDSVDKLAQAQFEAAALFEYCRLPEVFSGHPRDETHPFPAFYPDASWPQAWSASAIICHLQAILGLYPYAPLHLLLVDPHLPAWLPEITLKNFAVGKAKLTIRFFRNAKGYSEYTILDIRGNLHVIRQASPWSLTTHWPERLIALLKDLLPDQTHVKAGT